MCKQLVTIQNIFPQHSLVIIRLADFNGVVLPLVSCTPIAAAPFTVKAINASADRILSVIAASERMNDGFPLETKSVDIYLF